MNSDPHDSAAWRAFGMLDAGESTLFDEAMREDPGLRRARLEMDRLAAAIAATTAEPHAPAAGQLARLQRRLGLAHEPRNCPLWLAVSGWSAAAVLALLLAWSRFGQVETPAPVVEAARPAASVPADAPGNSLETKRLNQELEVLRRNLEEFHQRDRVMFQVLPGRAQPLVMTMVAPGETAASSGVRSPLTAILGDALAVTNQHAAEEAANALEAGQAEIAVGEEMATTDIPPLGPPMAVPIYDPARDAGTLVVSNLPPAAEGRIYHLWVTTAVGARPVYIGSLPESSASGTDSFDFSLGSSMILPAAFILTVDPAEKPAAPGESNTVLVGPPAAAR